MKTDITHLKKQITDLTAAINAKVAERQDLTAQIEAVNSAPPDKQAVIDLLHSYIDETAKAYPASLRAQIEGFVQNWRKGDYLKEKGLALLQNSTRPMVTELGVLPPPLGLLYLLKDAIKAGITRAVDEMELPDGIATPARLTQLAALQTRLDVIDAELVELFDDCAGLGIALPDGTLSAEEKEIRRRAAVAAQQKPAKIEVLTNLWPGDKGYVGPPTATPVPRSSAYEANDLPEDAFKLNHA